MSATTTQSPLEADWDTITDPKQTRRGWEWGVNVPGLAARAGRYMDHVVAQIGKLGERGGGQMPIYHTVTAKVDSDKLTFCVTNATENVADIQSRIARALVIVSDQLRDQQVHDDQIAQARADAQRQQDIDLQRMKQQFRTLR